MKKRLMGQYFYEDMAHLFRIAKPFYQKWARLPDDYQETYEQTLKEMQLPDFIGSWTFLTAWGTRSDGRIPFVRGLQ